MRRRLAGLTYGLLPIILLTGFFVAGISGGSSCNTYPKVGTKWFYNKNHFVDGVPYWQNMVENKLIA